VYVYFVFTVYYVYCEIKISKNVKMIFYRMYAAMYTFVMQQNVPRSRMQQCHVNSRLKPAIFVCSHVSSLTSGHFI